MDQQEARGCLARMINWMTDVREELSYDDVGDATIDEIGIAVEQLERAFSNQWTDRIADALGSARYRVPGC